MEAELGKYYIFQNCWWQGSILPPWKVVHGLADSWVLTKFLFFLHVLETERRALEPASPLSVVCWRQGKLLTSSKYPCKTPMWERCYYFKRRRLLYKQVLQRCSAPTINCKRWLFVCVCFGWLWSFSSPSVASLIIVPQPSPGRWCLEKGWRCHSSTEYSLTAQGLNQI